MSTVSATSRAWRAWQAPLVFLAFSFLVGCGDNEFSTPDPVSFHLFEPRHGDKSEHWSEVVDSQGVWIHENGRVGIWGPQPLGVEPVLRIHDGPDNSADYDFGDISAVEVPPSDGFAVAEDRFDLLRLYGDDGRYISTVGRPGEGPGEFRSISRLWYRGDTLVVFDRSQQRVTVFGTRGEVLADWPTRSRGEPVHLGPAGWVALVPTGPGARCDGPGVDARYVHRAAPDIYGRWDPEEARTGDTLLVVPDQMDFDAAEGRNRTVCPLFAGSQPRPVFDAEGRIFVPKRTTVEVDVLTPEGRLVRRIRRAYTPRPLTDRHVHELVERWKEIATWMEVQDLEGLWYPEWVKGWGARQSGSRIESQLKEALRHPIPEFLVPTGRLLLSPDGSMWLERTDQLSPAAPELSRWLLAPGSEGPRFLPPPSRWDVFDSGGQFLGMVDLPPGFTATAVRGLEVSGIQRDSMDVEAPARYRVVMPSSEAQTEG